MTTETLPEFTPSDVQAQLDELRFDSFDQSDAYTLGSLAAELVRENGYALAIQVVLGDHVVYKSAQGGVSPDTDSWLRRKAAVAVRDSQPSLLTRLNDEGAGTPLLVDDTYAVSGGAFPLVVGGQVVGTITASGLKDVVDHDLVVAALRSFVAN
ncbi:uncharacterized protein (UPF0303 family) [Frondihabitans sp. PhB188]|uniref:heme-binding protein n=1 Tax=Frondihabitans sp. PhB188 TaxID=2485200 RepID=UPI000F49ACE5|nr:heme-binding protein [Frondihabitans sp. PhB188]ROQ40784.1 uncharacterized protein (UPF0303 family) [Frondihabitans sp. PhB188]